MLIQTHQPGAHGLSRLPAHVKLLAIRFLADGSYLAYLRPSDPQHRKKGERSGSWSCMYQVAQQAQLDPNRLSFIGAVRVLRNALPEFQMTAPEQLPALYQRLLQDIGRKRLPPRRLRSNPRVVKRKMSNFKLKWAEHRAWPQPTSRSFQEAIEVKLSSQS